MKITRTCIRTRGCTLSLAFIAAAALLPALLPSDAAAQDRPNELALDISYVGGTLSYARRTGDRSMVGALVGIAGLWTASEHFGGDHFNDGGLIGLGHTGVFVRREQSDNFQVDVGVQLGLLLHGDNSGGGNAGIALFAGPYLNPMFGWRRLKFGPRIVAGYVYEGPDANAFGVIVDPVTARLTLRF